MLEVLVDNKDGNVWDISELVSDLSWKTSRIGKAGSLDITYIKDKNFKANNGDVVRVKFKDHNVFYGYVFEVGDGKDEAIKIKAYDQFRYLMANDTYVFKNITATQVIKQITTDFGLKTGIMEDTGYQIPAMVEDNKKLIDIICGALDRTLIATGRIYVLYDDFGQLALRNTENLVLDFMIGDESLMYDYVRKTSIDSDTYNRVKLVQENKETGRRDVHIAQDSANISKWGKLQLYQTLDEGMNAAQIKELLNSLLELKNRETKSLQIQAIGDIRVRAGCYIPVVIEEFGINQKFLVDECIHRIDGDDHTMTLELKVV